MEKKYIFILILMVSKSVGQVGIGTTSPDANAALEIKSADKGVLINRVSLVDVTNASPMSSHVAGMMIYNTSTNGSGDTSVSPGFYYNNGAKWVKLEPIPLQLGDIKSTLATTDHLGWYKLDGRMISSLPTVAQNNAISLGFTLNLPDATDKILKGKTTSETLLQTGGTNSVVINQNNLPNVNFIGTSSSDGLHTHTYTDRHNSSIENVNLVYGLLGILSSVVLNILNSNVGNKTSVTTNSTSTAIGNHSHTVALSSGGTNAPITNVKHLVTNTFVYLGK